MAISKVPGESFGVTLRFRHKGSGARVWIGIGLGPGHQGPDTIPANHWFGNWCDVPVHTDWTDVALELSSTYPTDFPGGVAIDANKVIAPTAPPYTAAAYAARNDDDWDDEVYVTVKAEWNIEAPESTYW